MTIVSSTPKKQKEKKWSFQKVFNENKFERKHLEKLKKKKS